MFIDFISVVSEVKVCISSKAEMGICFSSCIRIRHLYDIMLEMFIIYHLLFLFLISIVWWENVEKS